MKPHLFSATPFLKRPFYKEKWPCVPYPLWETVCWKLNSSMVRELLLVNWMYHIFQCKLSLNKRNWFKHVTLFNVTCLRKILSKCSSQINFPNMWHWSMSHVWEIYMNFPNMWHWTMSHVWEVYLIATFCQHFSQTCFNSYLYTLLECKSNDFKNVTLKNS